MGLLDSINSALQGANKVAANTMNSPLFNLGTGLMSGAYYGSNPGQGLMQGAQNYRNAQTTQLQQQGLGLQNAEAQLSLQQMMQRWAIQYPVLKDIGNKIHERMSNGQSAAEATTHATQGLFDSAPSNGPTAGLLSSTPAPAAPVQAPAPAGSAPAFATTSDYAPATPQAGAGAPSAPGQAGAPQAAEPQGGSGGAFSPIFGRSLGDDAQMGALMQMAGLPGGSQMTDYAKLAAQYDPQTATRLALAKAPLTIAQAEYQQAVASGDPDAIQRAMTNLRTVSGQQHIGSMSGILTSQLRDGRYGTTNPTTGLQTIVDPNQMNSAPTGTELMPGAAAAIRARSAAEAQGEAQGQVEEVTGQDGTKYYIPKSTLLGSGAAPNGAATGTPGSTGSGRSITPFQAALGPAQTTMLEGNAKVATQTNSSYQEQAENATNMLAQIQQLRSAAADMGSGKFEPARQEGLNILNSLGLISPNDLKRLGSAQEGTKLAIQLQAAATKQLGSREAAQIFEKMGASMPNLTLSSDGLDKISSYLAGIARYQQARAQVAQQYQSANDWKGVNNIRNDFIKNSDPTYYIVASADPSIQPEMIQSMGKQGPKFLQQWKAAVRAGYAPAPTQYAGQ